MIYYSYILQYSYIVAVHYSRNGSCSINYCSETCRECCQPSIDFISLNGHFCQNVLRSFTSRHRYPKSFAMGTDGAVPCDTTTMKTAIPADGQFPWQQWLHCVSSNDFFQISSEELHGLTNQQWLPFFVWMCVFCDDGLCRLC